MLVSTVLVLVGVHLQTRHRQSHPHPQDPTGADFLDVADLAPSAVPSSHPRGVKIARLERLLLLDAPEGGLFGAPTRGKLTAMQSATEAPIAK